MNAPMGGSSFGSRARAFTAANVAVMCLAALAIFGVVNFLATQSRFRVQWDVTDVGTNTLSPKTLGILRELPKKLGADDKGRDRVIEIVSFLSPEDDIESRAIPMVNGLLEAYRTEGLGRVTFTKFDPYAQLTAAKAKAQELKLKEIRNEVVIALGDKVRNIRLEDMVRLNHGFRGSMMGGRDEAPRIEENRIEETVTSNLLALLESVNPKAYFVAGHGEPTLVDSDRDGLSGFADALRKSSYDVTSLDLGEKGGVPSDATIVAWIAPTKPMPPDELAALRAYAQRGGRLLIAIDPTLDPIADQDALAFLGEFGVRSVEGVVCEPLFDPLSGQAFAGDPSCADLSVRSRDLSATHPVTKSLAQQQVALRFLEARALERVPDTPNTAVVEELVKTSKNGWIDRPPLDFVPAKPDADGKSAEPLGPKTLVAAITWTRGKAASASAPASMPADAEGPGGRAVVFGSTFPLRNVGFRFGRDLDLSSVEWLAGREFAAGIGPRPLRKDSLADVAAITPRVTNSTIALAFGAFALAGGVVYRRRRVKPGLVVAGLFGAIGVFYFALGWLA